MKAVSISGSARKRVSTSLESPASPLTPNSLASISYPVACNKLQKVDTLTSSPRSTSCKIVTLLIRPSKHSDESEYSPIIMPSKTFFKASIIVDNIFFVLISSWDSSASKTSSSSPTADKSPGSTIKIFTAKSSSSCSTVFCSSAIYFPQ